MSKLNDIIPYFEGNFSLALFNIGFISANSEYMQNILDKERINAAKIGALSNIFLAIKETFVDKNGNTFYSKVAISELEKNANLIAKKVSNGYEINGYVFPSAPQLVGVIRNKLAHGQFSFDLEHNRVIIDNEGVDIIINIDKLATFVISSLKDYMFISNENEYERDYVFSDRPNTGTFSSKDEIQRYIKTFKEFSMKISRNDGKSIEGYIIREFNYVFKLFSETRDYGILLRFAKSIEKDYTVSWSERKAGSQNMDTLVDFLYNTLQRDLDSNSKSVVIAHEVARNLNTKYNSFNPIEANLTNLILLDMIRKYSTIDKKVLFSYMQTQYPDLYINYDPLAMSLINTFTALFSFNYDNTFKRSENAFDGFDYSLLDISKFSIEKEKELGDTEIIQRQNRINNEINKVDTMINSNIASLANVTQVGNNVAAQKISNLLILLNQKKSGLITLLNNTSNELQTLKNNEKFLKGEALIEGIRNSIAHGNYQVLLGEDFNKTIIVFEDIYEGKTTFKASITYEDFYEFLYNSGIEVSKFISTKQKSLT